MRRRADAVNAYGCMDYRRLRLEFRIDGLLRG